MSSFEEYLLSIGYKPFRQFKVGIYEPITEQQCSSFSTMQGGCIDNIWIKEGEKNIYWGLSEHQKPPTLTTPRPTGIYNDDLMNQLLKEKTPEEIYNSIK